MGSKEFRPYVPLILSLFTFVLVNNIFGLIPLVQFPTMARIGFPAALAIRVFAAMFAGHLLLLIFTVGGQYLLIEASWVLKPVSLLSFAVAIGLTFLEALVQVIQAVIFAKLTAVYLSRALADGH